MIYNVFEVKEMKKFIAIFLVITMFLSFVACGKEGNNNNDDTHNTANNKIAVEAGILIFPDENSYREHVTKVEITKDNWQEYFGDYENTEHIVEKNQFGDIEREYDKYTFSFGLKEGIVASYYDTVSFKFDGITSYDGVERCYISKANETKQKIYNYQTNEFLYEVPVEPTKYFLVELSTSSTSNKHYTDYNCIDVIGTIYIFNLPDGVYNGEDLIERVTIGSSLPCHPSELDKILEE